MTDLKPTNVLRGFIEEMLALVVDHQKTDNSRTLVVLHALLLASLTVLNQTSIWISDLEDNVAFYRQKAEQLQFAVDRRDHQILMLERRAVITPRQSGSLCAPPPHLDLLDPRVKFMTCHPTGLITAIKVCREIHGLGLADAKNLVEAFKWGYTASRPNQDRVPTEEWVAYNKMVEPFVKEHAPWPMDSKEMLDAWNASQVSLVPVTLESAPGQIQTIDDFLHTLTEMRRRSPLGGQTCIVLCREDSGVSDASPTKIIFRSEGPGEGLVEICGKWEGDDPLASDK